MLQRLLVDLRVALGSFGVGVGGVLVGGGRLGPPGVLVASLGLVVVLRAHVGSIPYMRRLVPIAIVAALVAGCGDDEQPQPQASGPLVVYERTGGVAGVLERLRIDRDGHAELLTGPPEGERASFTLGDAELEQLEAQLEAADLSVPPGPPGCADCFEYSIVYGGQEARFDDLAEVPPSLRTVLDHLGALVARR